MSELTFSHPVGKDDYVFFPACCYQGNQFPVLYKVYPPMFTLEESTLVGDTPVLSDIPRLEPDGSGTIEVTTGDVSVPCIGVFSPSLKKGWLLFTIQEINGKNIGLAYRKGLMTLTYPAKRSKVYTMCRMSDNPEPYVPMEADIPYKFLEFSCDSTEQFFRVFFENRKIMGMDDSLPETIPPEEQLKIQIEKYNRMNWREYGGFYGVGTDDTVKYQVWQAGWTGGAMATYALLKLGGPLEKARSVMTLEHLFRMQGASGLFYGGCGCDLVPYGDGFDLPGTENHTLIRKSADVLYFVLRQFPLLDTVPDSFEQGIRRCADALVRIYEKYGELGQFADVETGELVVHGSVSAGIAPAGLVEAYRRFRDKRYLDTAQSLADHYYGFVRKGYTTGAPGEMLQNPDSESAFGLLESYVCLYEETGDSKYLDYACATAHLASSWVVPYNYHFPETSEFGRLGMKSVGSVFANLQNKHSAPGICTLSGTSLRRLYQYTGDPLYLELFREITQTVSQYLSTEKRPVRALNGEILPPGVMCERVNLSDWEGYDMVGSVFNGTCWCEVTNLLILADM